MRTSPAMDKLQFNIRKYLWLGAIWLLGCHADLRTKDWAASQLKEVGAIEVLPYWFELRYVENNAIAFSFLHSLAEEIRLPLIFGLSTMAAVLLLALLWHWRHREFTILLPLVLILSGAFGNILDRISNGFVIDFLHVHYQYQYSFPVFNIADILILIGFGLLFYQHWNDPSPSDTPPAENVSH